VSKKKTTVNVYDEDRKIITIECIKNNLNQADFISKLLLKSGLKKNEKERGGVEFDG